MIQTRSKKTRVLSMLLVVAMVLTLMPISALGFSIGGEIVVNVDDNTYDLTIKHVDNHGAAIDGVADIIEEFEGAGATYTTTAQDITDYVYMGFYVEGQGDLDNLTGSKDDKAITLTTLSDGSDATSGRGAYTLYAVYSKDDNKNEIPDEDENYVITEKFILADGTALLQDETVYVNNGVWYYGTAPSIYGYKYDGYYFEGTYAADAGNLAHKGGSVDDLISGDPTLLLQSDEGYGTYDVHFVYSVNDDDWATITFDANGGVGSMADQYVLKGVETALSLNQFTKIGYLFAGWSTTADGAIEYTDGQLAAFSGDTTLYAVWERDDSQWGYVVYDANGGSGSMDNREYIKSVEFQLDANQFTKAGYLFTGWSTTPDGAIVYGDEALVTFDTDVTTLYAVWERDDSQWGYVVFDANGGSGSMDTQEYIKGVEFQLSANQFTKAGYLLAGWSTEADGTVQYADQALVTFDTDVTTLYAVWERDDSQWGYVVFDANGGSGSMDNQEYIKGVEFQLSANQFTKAGYLLAGWSTEADGTVQYADEALVTFDTDVTTLYAVWERDDSQWGYVVFDANTGSGSMDNQEYIKGVEFQLNANQFTKAGYIFVGWSTTDDGAAEYGDATAVTFDTDVTNLYAVWTLDDDAWATVTYHANGGIGSMDEYSVTVLKGTSIDLADNQFSWTNCIFWGWSTSSANTALADRAYTDGQTDVLITEDLDLYAIWGTPDITGDMVSDQARYNIGDTVNISLTLYNNETANSTSLYNGVLALTIPDNMTFTVNSLYTTSLDGLTHYPFSYTISDNIVYVNMGEIKPGDAYIVNYSGIATASGSMTLRWGLDGDVNLPTTRAATGFSAADSSSFSTGGEIEVIVD